VDLRSIYQSWVDLSWRTFVAGQLVRWQARPIKEVWPEIKQTWEECQKSGEISPLAAAAGQALRVLTFSGYVRDTPGSSKLNIKWNKSQLRRWHPTLRRYMAGRKTGETIKYPHPHLIEWLERDSKLSADMVPGFLEYRFHDYGYSPAYPPSPKKLTVFTDYTEVQYPVNAGLTLAVCDPPYVGDIQDPPPSRRSGRYMSPSYFGHRPHAQSTYDMAVHSVRAALAADCHTVLGFNYYSDKLHEDYLALAAEHGYQCQVFMGDRLTGSNNNVKPAVKETPYKDTTWVFTKEKRVSVNITSPTKSLAHLDLFSGIGGFSLAAQMVGGIDTQQFVEINPFAQKVLNKNFPGIPIYGDVTTYTPTRQFDIVTGGFPCQDISQANTAKSRQGLKGDKSGLFFEIIRIIRQCRPRYVVLENSAALLNFRRGRDMGTILWELSQCGYDAEWSVVSACSMGAPHMRKRLFIVAYANSQHGESRMVIHEKDQRGIQAKHNRSSPSPWAEPPPKPSGVANGIPNRLDRVKSLGNAVAPRVAMVALKRVFEIEASA